MNVGEENTKKEKRKRQGDEEKKAGQERIILFIFKELCLRLFIFNIFFSCSF